MADQAEFDARVARLEAALTATSDALEEALTEPKAPDTTDDLRAAQDELQTLRQTIQTLEQEAKDREATLDTALARAKKAEADQDSAPKADASEETEALRTEIAELKAARAQDLAEMKSLLAELEPMLESADA